MSATGLDAFDRTLQATNLWLEELMVDIGPDRRVAWKVLGVVLHKLRDRLPLGLAAHVGAGLPLLVRGAYYDQFEPAKLPSDCRSLDQFCREVAERLGDIRPVDPKLAVQSVFALLSRHLDEGQVAKAQEALPRDIRQCWITASQVVADLGRDVGEDPGEAPNQSAGI